MKNIAIINACTDLGINIEGCKDAPKILTQYLDTTYIANTHTITSKECEDIFADDPSVSHTDPFGISRFYDELNMTLRYMHDAYLESNMNEAQKQAYRKKMYNLVLAIKALDPICEKQNLELINQFNEELYQTITQILNQNQFPLTVGGDHVVAIASSLASIKKHQNLGVIWFDAHADFNTYQTSVTGNLHGLPLAVITHYEKDILSCFHQGPFYNPKNAVIVGARDIDPWEWQNLENAGVTIFSTEDIHKQGARNICKKAFAIASKRYEWYSCKL